MKSDRTRVFIVEDHPLVREQLGILPSRAPDLFVAGPDFLASACRCSPASDHASFEVIWVSRNGARSGTRTHTPFRKFDFKSNAYTIPPSGRCHRFNSSGGTKKRQPECPLCPLCFGAPEKVGKTAFFLILPHVGEHWQTARPVSTNAGFRLRNETGVDGF